MYIYTHNKKEMEDSKINRELYVNREIEIEIEIEISRIYIACVDIHQQINTCRYVAVGCSSVIALTHAYVVGCIPGITVLYCTVTLTKPNESFLRVVFLAADSMVSQMEVPPKPRVSVQLYDPNAEEHEVLNPPISLRGFFNLLIPRIFCGYIRSFSSDYSEVKIVDQIVLQLVQEARKHHDCRSGDNRIDAIREPGVAFKVEKPGRKDTCKRY